MILNKKELDNLFSWSQFHENSPSLAVARYPRHYTWANGKKEMIMSEYDKIQHKKIQAKILEIGNKN